VTEALAQLMQESGLSTQVSQAELQGTHFPLIDTNLLSLEHSPEQVPVASYRFIFFGQDVQKSIRPEQV
jgi:hypothetical protein